MHGETRITYNGITLTNVLTKKFHEEVVYDASDTDAVCHRFVIAVVGFISEGPAKTQAQLNGTSLVGANAAAQQVLVRSALMSPRQTFLMQIGCSAADPNGEQLLRADAMGSAAVPSGTTAQYDVNNGPKPRSCDVEQVTGSTVLKVSFEIEICKVECDAAGFAPNNSEGVLSHRWSCQDQIDANFYTTRTFTGRLITVGGAIDPQYLRHWVVPRLTIGFRRESMSFRVTEDARTLEYTIVDKEVAFSAPYPATEWDYTYTVSSGDRKLVYASVDIMLKGPRDCVKAKLVEIAMAIFEARCMGGSNGRTKDEVIIEDLSVIDHYGKDDNSIRLMATVQHTGDPSRTFGLVTTRIGQPISSADLQLVLANYDFNISRGGHQSEPVYVSGPIPIVGAFRAYLQSPCNDQHKMVEATPVPDAAPESDSNVTPQLSVQVFDKLTDTEPDDLSQEHRDNPYTIWEIDSKYQTDDHRVAMPVAGLSALTGGPIVVATMAIAALAPPTIRRIIRIRGQRIGKMPELPEPKRNYTFLGGVANRLRFVVTPEDPRKTADDKEVYTLTAEIEYALTHLPKDTDPLPIGYNIWEDPAFAERKAKDVFGTHEP